MILLKPTLWNCTSSNSIGSFHSTPKLKVPENIILLFQPSHCPELNPIERLWEYLKGFLSWDLFSNLNDLKAKVTEILNSLSEEVIASVTGWKYIITAISTAGMRTEHGGMREMLC